MLLGLRTVIYKVDDLEQGKEWCRSILGIDPYFDKPFYVGFSVGGFELGLDPDVERDGPGPGGTFAYWGVADAGAAMKRLLAAGAETHAELQDVGEGIKVGVVRDPFGNLFGIIENPHFKLPA
jgi:uncharacterized glyoxalase superfamily protein PhnB